MPDSNFYLGRAAGGEAAPVLYDPADLTTHAVIIGMTGSGKTGLLIALLEEAARQGLPAIIIDPKGDLTNLLLHFPDLLPADFQPWLDPEAARRAGAPLVDLAAQAAARWEQGLAGWNLGKDHIRELVAAVEYAVYTPGSTAGTPVSLVSSFAAPALSWNENREVLRERIAATVTALLGLVGMSEIDPLRSREHILLSNLLEYAWSRGQSLDLNEIIVQVQTPPFERLGAFPLERFFPEKDRFDLALLLNNFLASPSFQTWMEGVELAAERFLYTPSGRPRFSIFYLAHLSETERMFFVTLLLASLESWMRAQRGTGSLRALLAFDEITGYLPPVANPPSRPVLLRLLKQARAFGVGLVLATQNPTDLNYKALSNAGSWFIGRLQTERDKERLLDGLQSLEGGIDRAAFDRLAAALKPRVFLFHNIHQPGPILFNTRWTLNFLAGPLTRAQIPTLVDLVPPAEEPPVQDSDAPGSNPANPPLAAISAAPRGESRAQETSRPDTSGPEAAGPYTTARPTAPAGVSEFFFPPQVAVQPALAALGGAFSGPITAQGLVYRPALMAEAEIRYQQRRYGLDTSLRTVCVALDPAHVDWEASRYTPFQPDPGVQPPPQARFAPLPSAWSTPRSITALQKDFLDWAYRAGALQLWANEALKLYAPPWVTPEAFRAQVDEASRAAMQPDLDKVAAAFDDRLETLKRKIERQHGAVERREEEVDQRKREQTGADFEFITSFLTRRKRSIGSSLTKRRLTSQAENELEDAHQTLEELQQEWDEVQRERQSALQDRIDDWNRRAGQITRVPVTPYRKDVFLKRLDILWLPYHLVKTRAEVIEAPAFILR